MLTLVAPGDPESLLFRFWRMQRFFKRQIEMHRSGALVGPKPNLLRQRFQVISGGSLQPLIRTIHNITANRLEKFLLIHGLIGAALLQTRGSIGGQQQQRLTGAIGFHRCRQKVGHSGARGGDHC